MVTAGQWCRIRCRSILKTKSKAAGAKLLNRSSSTRVRVQVRLSVFLRVRALRLGLGRAPIGKGHGVPPEQESGGRPCQSSSVRVEFGVHLIPPCAGAGGCSSPVQPEERSFVHFPVIPTRTETLQINTQKLESHCFGGSQTS